MTAGSRSTAGRDEPGTDGVDSMRHPVDPAWDDPAWALGADAPGFEASRPWRRPLGDAGARPEPVAQPAPSSPGRGRRRLLALAALGALAGGRWAYVEVAYHHLRRAVEQQQSALRQTRSDLADRELQLDAMEKRVGRLTAELGAARTQLVVANDAAAKAQADAASAKQQSSELQSQLDAARAAGDAHAQELEDAHQRALQGALAAARAEACEQRVADLERARGKARPSRPQASR